MYQKDNDEIELLLAIEETEEAGVLVPHQKKSRRGGKKVLLVIALLGALIALISSTSYALFTFNVTKNTDFKVKVGNLALTISDTETEDKVVLNNMIPTKDETALKQDGYNFTITNTGTIDSNYAIYLDEITLAEGQKLDFSLVKINLFNHNTHQSVTKNYQQYQEELLALDTGTLIKEESVNYTLRVWLDYDAGNESQNKYFASQIRVEGVQANSKGD